jgi:hypothetical protein
MLLSALMACQGSAINPIGPAGGQPPAPPAQVDTLPAGPIPSTVEACADSGKSAGRSPLRRLTKMQYARTTADLLRIETASAASSIPEDERAGQFRANALVAVSEAHVRRFSDAAETLSNNAVAPQNIERIFDCARFGTIDEACATQKLRSFGDRAFRRPLTDAEWSDLDRVFSVGKSTGGIREAVELVVDAILQTPQFLYHLESLDSVNDSLDDYARASRLSYFLLGSIPDQTLWEAARNSQLGSEALMKAQAERLMKDAKTSGLLSEFVAEWLSIENLETLVRDEKQFPTFSPDVARAMQQEAQLFTSAVWNQGDSTLKSLLTADYSYLPDALFPIYGIAKPDGYDTTKRMPLPKSQRAGILTQPAFLAARSFSDHTSPVKRGVFLLNSALCVDIKLPTGIAIPELPPIDPKQTTRERFSQHAQPGCSACHTPIDNLGFAFEKYDPVGAYRETESGRTVDDSGALALGNPKSDGPVTGGVAMVNKMFASEELRSCFTTQFLQFSLRRPALKADLCSLAKLRDRFESSHTDIRALALDVVTSHSFLAP